MSISDWVSFLLTDYYRVGPVKNGKAMLMEIVLDKALQNCYVLDPNSSINRHCFSVVIASNATQIL